ncbi:guanylate kinase [Patescibacteria group bacterium AH-259-L05]|nr:guanylate kinase [Patescibacteria group bacterium AH-259-L05]
MAKLFIITGLSGAGKDSITDGLKDAGLDYTRVITTTTRPMRKGEKQGTPYYFVSEDDFKHMISENKFFEWAVVYTNYYGNTKDAVDNALSIGKPVVLRIDCQGAETIKQKYRGAVVIFIKAPSIEILEKRLRKRGLDSDFVIKQRLKEVEKEMKSLEKSDYVVVNEEDKLDEAIEEVKNIILKESKYDRRRTKRQK